MDDKIYKEDQEGICIDRSSSSVSYSGGTYYIDVSFSVKVKDEDDDVAFKDANELREMITYIVHNSVKDYAADGQEVEE